MESAKAQEIRDTWKQRELRERKQEERRRRQARKNAERVAGLLKDKYQVKKVYLYGSVVWSKHYSAYSDIDMLVEGFPKEADYWGALAESERIAAPYPLSLVLAEDAHRSLYDRVKKEGLLL